MNSISANNKSHAASSSHGFTLIEVLIALTIMAFISFSIFQATTETFKLRDSLAVEGDFYNAIQLAMTIMQRDVALIYSPQAMFPKKPISSTPQSPQSAAQGGSSQMPVQVEMPEDLTRPQIFWAEATEPNGIRPSRLNGTEGKITFVTLSHIRIYKDFPESEFSKVTYELKRDEKSSSRNSTAGQYVLVKTETPNAFASDDIKDPFSKSFEILKGIKSMSFTYFQRDGNTWKKFKSWDTDKEETKNIFPSYIELKLEVAGPRNLNFESNFKMRPEIPLNGLNSSI